MYTYKVYKQKYLSYLYDIIIVRGYFIMIENLTMISIYLVIQLLRQLA